MAAFAGGRRSLTWWRGAGLLAQWQPVAWLGRLGCCTVVQQHPAGATAWRADVSASLAIPYHHTLGECCAARSLCSRITSAERLPPGPPLSTW